MKSISIKTVIVGLLIMIAGVSAYVMVISVVKPTQKPDSGSSQKVYTMSEVAKHADKTDCWLVIKGKVYDVTKFIAAHPGGDNIVQGCGQDATKYFSTTRGGSGHSSSAKSQMETYYIGDLQ